MKKFILTTLSLLLIAGTLPISGYEAYGQKKKKKKKGQQEVVVRKPPSSKYKKMFEEDKEVVSARGDFITIHKVQDKLYFELPLEYLDRDMLFATTITGTSDDDKATLGYKHHSPSHFRFTQVDSTIYFALMNQSIYYDKNINKEVGSAVKQNSIDPFLEAFKIVCMNDKGSAVVVDVSKLFVGSTSRALAPIAPDPKVSYRGDVSTMGEFKSFEDNIMVKSFLSYNVSVGSGAKSYTYPMTIEVTRTILLLPKLEDAMRPRLADRRIGIFLSDRKAISDDDDKIMNYSIIHRWDLQPKDEAAYRRGDLVEPIKPITFYLDDAFPALWREAIREGTLRWNMAFEKIGFKNTMQILDYPTDDPNFDPDNLKYSCIRYVPTATANAMGPSWVDPRTGEIINASVIVWHDVVKLNNNWRFVQTAHIDESVRAKKLPQETLHESLAYVLAHEVGHCLGFMHNMAASASVPVDSLRSISYTQEYGTTPSIMDYARFNYVAQPEDKGVRLQPPTLGRYDYYIVRYAYQPLLDAKNVQEDKEIIEKWVDEKVGDPTYRYGRQQIVARYDPSAIEEDLGDDVIKASDYGVKNLKRILPNLNNWISNEEDPDMTHRAELHQGILNQYARYIRAVLINVGGIYLNDVKAGTRGDTYRAVPKAKQREALLWAMKHIRDSEWLADKEVIGNYQLRVSPAALFRDGMFRGVLSGYQNVMVSAHVSDNPYTPEEFFNDIYNDVWRSTSRGVATTEIDRQLQQQYVEFIEYTFKPKPSSLAIMGVINPDNAYAPSVDDIILFGLDHTNYVEQNADRLRELEQTMGKGYVMAQLEQEIGFGSGYGWQMRVNTRGIDNSKTLLYGEGQRILRLLKSRVGGATGATRSHYQTLIYTLESAMSTN